MGRVWRFLGKAQVIEPLRWAIPALRLSALRGGAADRSFADIALLGGSACWFVDVRGLAASGERVGKCPGTRIVFPQL